SPDGDGVALPNDTAIAGEGPIPTAGGDH
ncbi:MAG: hypothetical protein OXFUSZZB_002583, partial [Candidatus Fervidibacter sp.]